MKDINQVKEQWGTYLRSISSFESLQAASLSDLNIANGIGHNALRSLLWKSLLLCHKLDLSTLIAAVRKERSAYDDHKAKYLRPPTNEQDPERFAGSDPLADDEVRGLRSASMNSSEMRSKRISIVHTRIPSSFGLLTFK
ncbi:hypothetical protein TWF718_001281 [Orbilia javanica]|uniref:Rab-GAP TBC domain-containing protein n=1 Tax=Orbilia javanica TaxID=47235 RepID=A0AAN8N127_9PEZI